MSQLEIRLVTAADHAAWLPLWQAYLRFYNTELPDAVSQSTPSATPVPAQSCAPTRTLATWSTSRRSSSHEWRRKLRISAR